MPQVVRCLSDAVAGTVDWGCHGATTRVPIGGARQPSVPSTAALRSSLSASHSGRTRTRLALLLILPLTWTVLAHQFGGGSPVGRPHLGSSHTGSFDTGGERAAVPWRYLRRQYGRGPDRAHRLSEREGLRGNTRGRGSRLGFAGGRATTRWQSSLKARNRHERRNEAGPAVEAEPASCPRPS